MTTNAKEGGAVEVIQALEDMCGSDKLSLDALQQIMDGIHADHVKKSPFFHKACMNKLVSLEIIECILRAFPKAALESTNVFCDEDCPTEVPEETSAFPLHLVCYNDRCPSPVIDLLLEKNPTALHHACVIKSGVRVGDGELYTWVPGTPLHYLLARESNIDTDTVKMLIEAYPESLAMVDGDSGITPIHIILSCSWSDTNKTDDALYDILTFFGGVETASFRKANDCDDTPLHYACSNKNASPRVVQLLLNHWPESAQARDNVGGTPLHNLCLNGELTTSNQLENLALLIKASTPQTMLLRDRDGYCPIHIACQCRPLEFCKLLIEATPNAFEILYNGYLPIHEACECGMKDTASYLLRLYPESTNVQTDTGNLPIHLAASGKSLELCKMLIDANPGSVRALTTGGKLPLHCASGQGEVDIVQHLINLYPQSISVRNGNGFLPIHCAASPASFKQTEKIKLFLMHDPTSAASKATGRRHRWSRNLPLHLVCDGDANLDSVQLLFDTYPEAIFTANSKGRLPMDLAKKRNRFYDRTVLNAKVIRFLEKQMTYGIKARDKRAMTTSDSNGWLPLHHALHENAPVGAIKLLVAGNPSAVKVADDNMAFPLHIACEFNSIDAVKYLLELNKSCIGYPDSNKDSPLHFACRGGNFKVIKYLLESMCVPSVSDRNSDDMLPIQLLLEAGEGGKIDRDSAPFVEAIWTLLLAHPETVLN